ncbi:hypothetical protein BLA29_015252, partial [Euroglyphus maynei]
MELLPEDKVEDQREETKKPKKMKKVLRKKSDAKESKPEEQTIITEEMIALKPTEEIVDEQKPEDE